MRDLERDPGLPVEEPGVATAGFLAAIAVMEADSELAVLDDEGDTKSEDREGSEDDCAVSDQTGEKAFWDALAQDSDDEEGSVTAAAAIVSADPVRDYLREIGKTPLLTAEQEVELAKAIEAGLFAEEALKPGRYSEGQRELLEAIAAEGKRAKEHLISANLRFVVFVAKWYIGRGLDFLELIQEGNLGLIRAAEKFDYTKGYKFNTYADWWVRRAIKRALADTGKHIRIPMHMTEMINKMNRVERHFLGEYSREPTPEELAEELELKVEQVLEIQRWRRQDPVSYHQPTRPDEAGERDFGDLIMDDDMEPIPEQYEGKARREALEAALDRLSERERAILLMRFGLRTGDPKGLDETARELGTNRESVRRHEKRALAKLRHPAFGAVLRSYID